jgi:hypothetical protein
MILLTRFPQTKERITQKAGWDATSVAATFEAVKNNKSPEQEVKHYRIPYPTLHDRLKSDSSSKKGSTRHEELGW